LPQHKLDRWAQSQISLVFHENPIHTYIFKAESRMGQVMADEKLLHHILINLLTNAVKYSPEGGEIRLELSSADDDLILRVSDQGLGIPEEDQKHLFEPFHRASNTEQIKGVGLGLVVVLTSVETWGGTIVCQSAIGRGTVFTIKLPLRKIPRLVDSLVM